MKRSGMNLKRLLCLLLVLGLLLSVLPLGAAADDGEVYLAFSSDVHNSDNDKSARRLELWLKSASAANGDALFDAMGFCGDMASANDGFNAQRYWQSCDRVLSAVRGTNLVGDIVYTTGNHEYGPGDYADSKTGGVYDEITRIGLAKQTADYEIYCFGARQYDYQFQEADIALLKEYLDGAPNDIPIFVLSHFPLHHYGSRTIGNAQKVIDVLNSHKNVIFLWGHNHTESDTFYDHVYCNEVDGKQINFIYAAAGCMSDDEYSGGSNSVAGKGLVAKLDGDSTLLLTYYGDAERSFAATANYEVDLSRGTARLLREIPLDENEPDSDFYRVSALEDGAQYVITAGDLAMTDVKHDGYHNRNGYDYYGFTGGEVEIWDSRLIAGVKNNMVWTAEAVQGGFALRNAEGKYLTAEYENSVLGCIRLGDTPDAWSFDGSVFRSIATGKYINYEVEGDLDQKESGSADLFDIRSSGKDTFAIYKAVPAGWQPGPEVVYGTYASELQDGASYVITAQGQAMTGTYHEGYTCENGNTYSYHGFTGRSVSVSGTKLLTDVGTDAVWTAKKVEGGFALRSASGKYLNATYLSGAGGYIELADAADAWVYDGSTLKHAATGKQLNYETDSDVDGTKISGTTSLFDIRTNADDEVRLYAVDPEGSVYGAEKLVFVEPGSVCAPDAALALEDGKTVMIVSGGYALSSEAHDGYETLDNAQKYYKYYGMKGVKISGEKLLARDVPDTLLWTVKAVSGGFTLKSVAEGKYLRSTYTKGKIEGSDFDFTGIGYLYLDAEKGDTWSLHGSNLQLQDDDPASGKRLNWCTGHSGTLQSGSDNFFTVRSGGTDCVTWSEGDFSLVSGKKYAIVINDHALNGTAANYTNGASGYIYYGFSGVSGTVTNGVFSAAVSDDLLWTVTSTADGLTIQNAKGKYLYSYYKNGGYVRLDDFPHYWTLNANGTLQSKDSGKFLTWDPDGSILGVRSEGTATQYPVSLFVTARIPYVGYRSAGNGTVSNSLEYVNEALKGASAAPAAGYHFSCWKNAAGDVVSESETLIPDAATITDDTVFTAYFEEDADVVITYTASAGGTVTVASESVAPVTGRASGSVAVPDEGFHFLYWENESGKKVSTRTSFLPRMESGLNVAGSYTAVFEHDPLCHSMRPSALEVGDCLLTLGGTEYGSVTLGYISNSWTVYDNETHRFIGVNGSSIALLDQPYYWSYDGGFYTKVNRGIGSLTLYTQKMYLDTTNGRPMLSKKAVEAAFLRPVDSMEHSFTYTNNYNGTHTVLCTVCGERSVAAHSYADHVCVCGASDLVSEAVTDVEVTVTKNVKVTRFLLIFRRVVTTYDAVIEVKTDGVDVASVRRSSGNGWITGTSFSSSVPVKAFDIEVTDSNGAVTYWYFNGTETVQM